MLLSWGMPDENNELYTKENRPEKIKENQSHSADFMICWIKSTLKFVLCLIGFSVAYNQKHSKSYTQSSSYC